MSLSERLKVAQAARHETDVDPVQTIPDPVEPGAIDSIPCPRCGSQTQVDMYDLVHQTVSLSCTNCFHMYRIPG